MAVTSEQARAELARRELAKRGVSDKPLSLMDRAGQAMNAYKNSPLYQASPVGMLNTADQLVSKGFNKVGEMTAEKMATTTNPFTKRPFSPNTSAAVGTGIQMIPDVVKNLAAPISEGMNPSTAFEEMKPTGPFTAGLKSPRTALPGEFDAAQEALGKAKTVASGAGLDPVQSAQISRFENIFASGSKAHIGKLAREGKAALESGRELTSAEMVSYRAAFGKAQAMGGPYANEWAKRLSVIDSQLGQKYPQLLSAIRRSALNYLATGGEEFKLPSLTLAVDHGVGAAKTLINASKTGAVKNAAGAALGLAARRPGMIATGTNVLMKYINKDKK